MHKCKVTFCSDSLRASLGNPVTFSFDLSSVFGVSQHRSCSYVTASSGKATESAQVIGFVTMTTSALRTGDQRGNQPLEHEDSRVQASVAVALQSSLSAPNRVRSITIDDFRDDASLVRSGLPEDNAVDASSSDSDGDENEDLSRRAMREKRKRTELGRLRNKGTASALSLESLQNDSDSDSSFRQGVSASPGNNRATPVNAEESRVVEESPPKRQNAPGGVVQAPMGTAPAQMRMQTSHWVSPQARQTPSIAVNNAAAVPVVDPKAPQARAKTSVPSKPAARYLACATCGAPSQLDTMGTYSVTCQCASKGTRKQGGHVPKQKNTSQSGDEVITVNTDTAGTDVLTNQRGLVNIASVPESDGSGWDRFIFFSFRPQRFHFPKSTYLSAFSPFAAVASGMEGVSSTGVCAVCGAGQTLVRCSRCPLAFHSRCIDPLRVKMARHPWFCDACKAVKGEDRTQEWNPLLDPSPLPSPATGFARLIADARDGNPIDFVFNPTLHHFYKAECGHDWLRCSKCNEVHIAEDGVLAESVHVPFECKFAFWSLPVRPCSKFKQKRPKTEPVKKVEAYVRGRSRRRNALFYYGFGEDDREDFGYPSENRKLPAEDVIVIDEDEPETVAPAPRQNPQTATKADNSTVMQTVKPVKADESNVRKTAQPVKADDNSVRQTAQPVNRPPLNQDKKPSTRTNIVTTVQDVSDAEFDISFGKPQLVARNNTPRTPEQAKRRTGNGTITNIDALRRPLPVPYEHANGGPKHAVSSRIPEIKSSLKTTVPSVTLGRPTLLPTPSGPVRIHPDHAALNGVRENHTPVSTSHASAVEGAAMSVDARIGVLSNPVIGAQQFSGINAPSQQRPEVKREDESDDRSRVQQGDRTDDDVQQGVLACIASLDFDVETEDCLTDLALDNNRTLFNLYTGMRGSGEKFKRQATRLALRHMAGTGSGTRQNKRDHIEAFPLSSAGGHGVQLSAAVSQVPPSGPLSHQQLEVSARLKQLEVHHAQQQRELYEAIQRLAAITPAHAVADLQSRQREAIIDLTRRQQAELRQERAGAHAQSHASRK